VNAAVNPAVDPISGQPELKHTPVDIRAVDVRWHGTILARRPIMLPELSYWARLTGAGFHAYLMAGAQSLADAHRALSAAMRATNPGPWHEGERGIAAVIGDGPADAIMALGETYDEALRDRLAPFMALDRLDPVQRAALLSGGDAEERGGEICACFGVSTAAVEAAMAGGALSLEAVGEATRAGMNCGSCRPEIRALLRAARPRKAA
jgi:assimilatory nitrate reductase catalytic subunit